MNLFGGSSTKQRPDSEPRSLGDHGSVFRFLGSQLEGKILRGPMWLAMTNFLAAQSVEPFGFVIKQIVCALPLPNDKFNLCK